MSESFRKIVRTVFELRALASLRSFATMDISCLQTVEVTRILKNNSWGKCCWEYAGQKFSFAPIEAKIQLFKSYYYPIYGCALWRHSYQNSIRKLTVSFSDTFKRPSPDTPARVWHLRWTQLNISMLWSKNLLTAWRAEAHQPPQTVLFLLLSIAMLIISLHW